MHAEMAMAPMSLGALFALWAGMMATMMLPGAMPRILQYAGAGACSTFAAGYLVAWTAFSGCVALLQWWLERSDLLSEDMGLR